MASFNHQSSQIKLLFESGCIDLIGIQYTDRKPLTTLYVDKYFSFADCELPMPYHQNIIGFLYPEDSTQSPCASHFYYTLSAYKVIYRAFEETPEYVIYILCDDSNPISRFLMVSFSFYELFSMNIYLNSFSAYKPEEVRQRYVFYSWLESYKQCLGQWMSFSAEQKSQIADLVQEVKQNKEKEIAVKHQKGTALFGDCLLCCDNRRSIVFLPCGHIVGCVNCVVKCMKIELNKKINKKRNPKLCPLCNGVITRALEVNN